MTFKVTLQPSGNTYETNAGESILTSGLHAGYYLPYSCRSGVCQTCRCRVIAGEVDHGNVSPAYFSEEEKRKGYSRLCQATALSDLIVEVEELNGIAGFKPRVVPCRVLKLDRLTPEIAILHVRVPLNENLLFLAGQYVEFILSGGERRAYSIANAPTAEGATEVELHLRHTPGGRFTDHVFGSMKTRELLVFEGPLGTFSIREESEKPIIFIASGTGFAPIKAMLSHAFKTKINETRPLHFYWGGRTRRDLYMLDMANQWAEQYRNFRFVPVLSEPTDECSWMGRTGLVHRAVMDDYEDLHGYQVYACGSPPMVAAARRDFTATRSLPVGEFFADAFLSASDRAGPVN